MKIEFYHTFNIPEKNINIEGQWDLNPTVHNLQKINVAGKTLLDVACRDGWYSYFFEKQGANVSCLDVDNRRARKYIHNIINSRVIFYHCNGYSINNQFPARAFDVTFAGDVLCHVQDPIRFLRNIHHVTKEHFYIVADVWPKFEMWYGGYPWKFSQAELLICLRMAGFKNVTVIDKYQINGAYWKRRGCQSVRDVVLVKCEANPEWRFGNEEAIVPANQTVNDIPELTYDLEFGDNQ